ncbi:caspase-8-like [Saccostrea echinata]|uniref:caspase-8-like n=1 Tax=Saccostrea echinata TaxID=191078 RepID=UPI002A81F450|nr:caspase-8-like [Saccostrea echinata]
MDECVGERCVLAEIGEKIGREDFRSLSFLSKDFISNRKRQEMKNSLELFLALEEKMVIQCKGGDFSFLLDAFTLMQRNDIVRILNGGRNHLSVVAADTSNRNLLLEKRMLLFKVGEETGKVEFQKLKEQLSRFGVGKRALDHVTDVWDALDLLEEKVSDSELFHCLKTVYKDEEVQTILDDFNKGIVNEGATGCTPDKIPVQEVGEEDIADKNDLPNEMEGSENPQTTLSPDGSPSGFSTLGSSRLGAYDRGRHPGICVIINNKDFADENMQTRTGTEVDRDKLDWLFKSYGFNVLVHNNQSREGMLQILEEVRNRNHQDNGALVVCVLSHGKPDAVFGSCGGGINITSMTSLFRADKCQSLAGKPKFFILQACQGYQIQNVWHRTPIATPVESDIIRLPPNGTEASEVSEPGPTLRMPSPSQMSNLNPFLSYFSSIQRRHPSLNMATGSPPSNLGFQPVSSLGGMPQLDLASAEADFLIAHSTMSGYMSMRDEREGSFFVQSLVKHLKEHSPREDVVSILTEVNKEVSQKIGKTRQGQIAVQMPEPKLRLTKKFYLYPVETEV